ncbi:MAG: ABC transporter permease [Acidobacteriota bacterium]
MTAAKPTRRRFWPALSGEGAVRATSLADLWIVLILLALVAIFGILAPSGTFLTLSNFRAIAVDTSEVLLLAAGQTIVLIAAGIDLSIGSLVIFCAVITARALGEFAGPAAEDYPYVLAGLAVAVPASLVAGTLWGVVNGWITVKWKVPPFIVTLGTLWMALGLAQVISGGYNVASVPRQLQNVFVFGGLFGVVPWPVVIAAAGVGVLWILLARTRFGMRTYALGANREALRRAGVAVDRHTILVYAVMGFVCGVVGLMDVARFSTASLSAHQLDNLNAIAAVVIGGTSLFGGRGHMSGTVIGAFIPAVLRNGFIILAIQPFWQNVVVGAFLVMAVYVDQVRRGGLRGFWTRFLGREGE